MDTMNTMDTMFEERFQSVLSYLCFPRCSIVIIVTTVLKAFIFCQKLDRSLYARPVTSFG